MPVHFSCVIGKKMTSTSQKRRYTPNGQIYAAKHTVLLATHVGRKKLTAQYTEGPTVNGFL